MTNDACPNSTVTTGARGIRRRSVAAMSPRLTLLFALGVGAGIANLYWSQPLVTVITGWSTGGWTAVTGTALCCFALTVWALGRRGPLLTLGCC